MQKLVIIGAGAAGMFCAVNVARLCPQLKVIVLEKSSKLLAKVKVSGGGRCNLTHHAYDVGELIENYPRGKNFLKKEFHLFTVQDTLQWFRERGVQTKTEKDGRVFPESNSSQTIIDCLLHEAQQYRVDIRLKFAITDVEKRQDSFVLHSADEEIITDFLLIASGGAPTLKQYDWLQKLQLIIEPPVPSLFTFNVINKQITKLMGVSVPQADIKIGGSKLRQKGALLITHWGFSGPAILKLSAWGARLLSEKKYQFKISINWIPNFNENTLRKEWNTLRVRHSSQKLGNNNPFALPARLWHYLLHKAAADPEKVWGGMSAKTQNKLIQLLTADDYEIAGKTTFKEEFVTAGGISLSEINAATLESRRHQNLFFAGEIMDVDGVTGGFNFQHAWSSAMIVARTISQGMAVSHQEN